MVGAQDESIAGFFSMGKPEPVDFRGKEFGEIFGAVQGAVDRTVE